MLAIERENRDVSYYRNLEKEQKLTEMFIKWCKENGWRYKVNKTDDPRNLCGEDVYIRKGDRTASIDIKGFRAGYTNVPLSYERKYGNQPWHKIFNKHKITTHYAFVCIDTGEVYFIRYDDVLFNFDEWEKTETTADKAGHAQKILLLPIINLNFGVY